MTRLRGVVVPQRLVQVEWLRSSRWNPGRQRSRQNTGDPRQEFIGCEF